MHLSIAIIVSVFTFYGFTSASPVRLSQLLTHRDCSNEISAFNLERRERNVRRSTYPTLLNLTCILAPEAALEDYIANPPVRRDVTDGQSGIALTLDIGILDVTTCKPLPNVMVEVWSPNAQGDYGNTFLRGATSSSSNGIAEFQTIFPGFTSEGANHINLMVHTSSSVSSKVAHVGQVFFTDKWTTIIGMQAPYNTNAHTRISNLDDLVYTAANKAGFFPVVDIESIHDDWPEGVIGYITVGVDPTKSRSLE